MIRVGFVFILDNNWLGGVNYFRNLIAAIYSIPDRKIEPVLFVSRATSLGELAAFPGIEIIRSRLMDRYSPSWFLRKLLTKLMGRDVLLERLLLKHHVSLLSHTDALGRHAALPCLCWIPDFQHRRLPQFFQDWEIRLRDRMFERWMKYGNDIILSSRAAEHDLKELYPNCPARTHVLNFVSAVAPLPSHFSFEELRVRLNLPAKYFLVANQFWGHKNHQIIVQALAKLKAAGHEVYVVASGNTSDHRQPDTFINLIELARQLDVEPQFKALGMISFSDLSQVMHHALAFINPSLFEGWNTSVEEAKSLGKPVLLSDIAVHREQAPKNGMYFPALDADTLANQMLTLWKQSSSENHSAVSLQAQSEFAERQTQFGQRYQEIVLETLNSPNHRAGHHAD